MKSPVLAAPIAPRKCETGSLSPGSLPSSQGEKAHCGLLFKNKAGQDVTKCYGVTDNKCRGGSEKCLLKVRFS